jgi:hypothetical protein
MGQKWQVRSGLPMREGKPEPEIVKDRTLQWAEISGLIEVAADGSWRPTAFGRRQLLKLERERTDGVLDA